MLFWTADFSLPVNSSIKLTVEFMNELKELPESNTCPRVLQLPTVHKTYEKFRNAMDTAVAYGKYGFGKM